jgi:hypothetical protein
MRDFLLCSPPVISFTPPTSAALSDVVVAVEGRSVHAVWRGVESRRKLTKKTLQQRFPSEYTHKKIKNVKGNTGEL